MSDKSHNLLVSFILWAGTIFSTLITLFECFRVVLNCINNCININNVMLLVIYIICNFLWIWILVFFKRGLI